MIQRIIKIDKEKCNGCGLCAKACHEGAIEMIDNKAVLTREDYCDGLGDCLPACPVNAISFEQREVSLYNEETVKNAKLPNAVKFTCLGKQVKNTENVERISTQLAQWPCQIKLVPVNAPYFDGANLLIAADCTAYSYGNFHNDFMKNHITLIGCPKLDESDYFKKLYEIIKNNNIRSVTIVRMEVPCCSGIENAAKKALQRSGKFIPWQITTLTTDGKILE